MRVSIQKAVNAVFSKSDTGFWAKSSIQLLKKLYRLQNLQIFDSKTF